MVQSTQSVTISRILKVNHAGEYGAIRIYRAQLKICRRRTSNLAPFLEETLAHEIAHCRRFLAMMPARRSRPCRAMPLWGMGGYLLGLATALLGENAVLACTRAVETAVHKHLDDQISYLKSKDDELHKAITEIQKEELQHLCFASENLRPNAFTDVLEKGIALATEIVIWLSTQGDVSRMKREIRQTV